MLGDTRLRLAAIVLFGVVLGGFVLLGSTAVSAALPGRIGAPAAALPLAERPAGAEPLVRLAILGDVGTGETDELRVAAHVAAAGRGDPFDALILLGDNVYPDGDASRLDATVFGPFGPVLDSGAELLAVLGNHDVGYTTEQIAALGMGGRWYSQRVGNVLFVGLDSTDPENPAQLAWLEATLAGASADWVVAGMHHPPFSAGVHGSDEDTRDSFVPLFERFGVDVVFAGHDHDYQRSVPIAGVTYVVSGGGAKVRATGTAPFTATSAAVLHFVEVAVWPERLELNAVGLDGVFDRYLIDHDRPIGVPSATFAPSEGLFVDEDTSLGARLATFGAAMWATALAVGWLAPRTALNGIGKLLIVASTAAMLSVVTGIGMVTVGLVG